jgi:PAS domain S-box-containing protein
MMVGQSNSNDNTFRIIFERNSAVMLLIDPETGLIIDANHAAVEFYGHTMSILCSMTINEIIIVSTENFDLYKLKNSNEILINNIFRHKLANGDIRTVEVNNSPFDNNGQTLIFSIVHDISDFMKCEINLLGNNLILNQIIDSIPQSVFWKDLDSNYLGVNRVFAEQVNMRPNEILGKNDFHIPICSEDAKIYLDDDKQIMASKEPKLHIIQNLKLFDGTSITAESSKIPLLNKDGDVYGILGVFEDITERNAAVEDLKKSEERFRLILENMPILLNAFDENGNIIIWNKACEDATGYKAEEIIGNPKAFELLYPNSEYRDKVWNSSLDQNFENNTYDLITKDNESRSIEWFDIYHHLNIPGWATWGIGQDITDRKRAEAALRDSEANLNTLIDTIPDLVWLKDRNGVFLKCNLRFESYFGAKENEIIGKTDYDFVEKNLADFFRKNDQAAIDAGKPKVNEEIVTFASDGHIEILETIKTPIFSNDGTLIGVLGIGRDITDRKQSEEKLRKSEEKFSKAFNTIQEAISINTIDDGKYIEINDAFLIKTGYLREEIIGHSTAELNFWLNLEERNEFFEELAKNGSLRNYGIKYRMRNNEIRDCLISSDFIELEGKICTLNFMLDITEHKLAEEALQKSEELYRKLLMTVPEIIVRTDLEGNILFVNDTAFPSLGFILKDSITGKNMLSFIAEKDIERAIANTQLMFEKPLGVQEYLMRFDDDIEIHCEVIGEVLRELDNKPFGMVFVVRDITDRKRAEEALKISERKTRAILDQTFQFIGMLDPDGILLDANRTSLEFSGVKLEDVIGKPFWETKWWNHSIEMQDKLKDAIKQSASGKTVVFEANHIDCYNRLHYIDFSLKPVIDNMNNVLFLIPEGRDITEKKLADEALKESELYYRTLFESANDAIFLMHEDKFTDCNKKVLEMFECSFMEIIGQPPYKFSPLLQPDGSNSRDKALEKINLALNGKPQFFEWVHSRYDGTLFDADVSLNRIEKNGYYEIQAIVRDITARKRAEAEVVKYRDKLEDLVKERTAQLEVVNNELEAFSYSVSHDLRAPLRSIDGFSNALLEDYFDILDEDGKDFLNRIRRATQSMGQLIDSLLSLSRISRNELNYDYFDLSEIAKNIINDLEKIEPSRNIEIIIKPNLFVNADYKLMEILLINLIKNALKFTKNKLNSKVEIGDIEISNEQIYYVKDNGAGFNMDYINKLFSPFQRLHSINEFEGTGIGLATVKRIISMHGGRIWAEGKVDYGATFYFTLK